MASDDVGNIEGGRLKSALGRVKRGESGDNVFSFLQSVDAKMEADAPSSTGNRLAKRRKVEEYEETYNEDVFARRYGRVLLAHVEVESNTDIRPLWRGLFQSAQAKDAVEEWNQARQLYTYPLPNSDVDLTDAISMSRTKDKDKDKDGTSTALSLSRVWSMPSGAQVEDGRVRPIEFLKRRKMEWHDGLESLLDHLFRGKSNFFYVAGLERRRGNSTRTNGCLPTCIFQRHVVDKDEDGGCEGGWAENGQGQELMCLMVGVTAIVQSRLTALNAHAVCVDYGDAVELVDSHASTLDIALRKVHGKHLVLKGEENLLKVAEVLKETIFAPVDSQRYSTVLPRLIAPTPFLHGCLYVDGGTVSTSVNRERTVFKATLGEGLLGSSIPSLVQALTVLVERAQNQNVKGGRQPLIVPDTGKQSLGEAQPRGEDVVGLRPAVSLSKVMSSLKNPFSTTAKSVPGTDTRKMTSDKEKKDNIHKKRGRKGSISDDKENQSQDEGVGERGKVLKEAKRKARDPYFTVKLVHHYRCDELTYLCSQSLLQLPSEADVGPLECHCHDPVLQIRAKADCDGRVGTIVCLHKRSRDSDNRVLRFLKM